MPKEVEESEGHVFKGEEEGDREEKWVSNSHEEKVEVLCGPGFPGPLCHTTRDEQQCGAWGRGNSDHRVRSNRQPGLRDSSRSSSCRAVIE